MPELGGGERDGERAVLREGPQGPVWPFAVKENAAVGADGAEVQHAVVVVDRGRRAARIRRGGGEGEAVRCDVQRAQDDAAMGIGLTL